MHLRILMLEDSAEDAELIERALRGNDLKFKIARVDDENEFIEKLDSFKPTVILSDHALPQFNSISALKICQKKGLSIPFILVTGTVSDQFAVNCLKLGADDYILKSNLSRLPASIKNALQQRKMELELSKEKDRLRQQNISLLKRNEELSAFTNNIENHLRLPITSMLDLINLTNLKGGTSMSKLSECLASIEGCLQELDHTFNNIIDYSRWGHFETAIKPIDWERIIENSFGRITHLPGFEIIERNIDVSQKCVFYGHEYHLFVIITNILSNSIKYFDSKKSMKFVTVKVTITKSKAVLFVVDNGVGIARESLTKIFDKKNMATNQSTGIGLYTVKKAIDKLNGTIVVQSTIGEGTIVVIHIPNARVGNSRTE